jgi:hypothetical protein
MNYIRYSPKTLNLETHPFYKYVSKCWQTDDGVYDILFDKIGIYWRLRIRRIDNQPIHDYMDLLTIKNDLWGHEVIAIEVYPKMSSFKNGSNTYHLWTWVKIKTPDLSVLYEYLKEIPAKNRKTDIIDFVVSHKTECYRAFKICASHKGFNTKEGSLLVDLARSEIGYSPKTWNGDIYFALWNVYKTICI